MRTILSPSHRPFIIMACSSTPQPGSTVLKLYRNGEPDILWCVHLPNCAVLSGIPPRQSFDYVIPINSSGQWGTYWVHAHSRVCLPALVESNPTLNITHRVNMSMVSVLPLLSTLQRKSIHTMPNIPSFYLTGITKSMIRCSRNL
jgi:hypothetical protein